MILPPNDGAGTSFGRTLTVQNGTAIIGAHADDFAGENVGAAYVYALRDTTWTQMVRLAPRDATSDTHLCSESLSADASMVACSGWHDGREAVFVFSLADSLALSTSASPRQSILSVQIYPNPVAEDAFVELRLEDSGHTRIAVYDVLGRLQQVLEDGYLQQGNHRIEWHLNGRAAGVYLIRLEARGASTLHPVIFRP